MKIKVGDRVKFLNDTGSGEVTRIIDQKTVLVQIEGGFEVPCLMNNLVVASGSYGSEDEEVEVEEVENEGVDHLTVSEEKKSFSESVEVDSTPERIEDEELLLAFLPEESSSGFTTYLINSSSYLFKYTISRQQEGEMVLFHESTLEAGIKVKLGKYKPGNLNDVESFRIQGVFFNAGFYRHLAPVDIVIRVSAAEMYEANLRQENDYFHDKAILHPIHDWRKPIKKVEMEIDAELLKNALMSKGDIKPATKVELPKPGLEEVDLHIEQLMDNYKSLTNSEIVDIQISQFRTALESAIIHKTRRIVFIHGVGNGKLKHEIRRILDTEYKTITRYQDASFKEYGYGATMVMVK